MPILKDDDVHNYNNLKIAKLFSLSINEYQELIVSSVGVLDQIMHFVL